MSMCAKSGASAIAQHADPPLRPIRQLAKIKYRLHNSVRVVVRHVVAARDKSVVNQTSEPLTVGLDALRHHHRILRRVQNDRRNGDLRLGRQLSLDLAVHRIARRQTIPMTIRVDHHIHEVRVIEGQRSPIEILGWERTARSPFPPQLPRQLTPVASQTSAAPLAMKVVLIPGAAFLRWQRRLGEARNVLNLVTADSDQPADPLRPQRRSNTRCPATPIETDNNRTPKPEPIDHLDRIPTNRRLLTSPRYHIRQKPGRAEAAQIGRDNPAASSCESVRDGHIRPRVVRKAMQQQHRPPTRRTRSLRHNR